MAFPQTGRPAAWASASAVRKSRRNRRDSTRTGSRKSRLQRTERVPSSDMPPRHEGLDHADIDALLEQVDGEAVPQRVPRHAFRDPRSLGGSADNTAELPGRQRLDPVAAEEQPASRQKQAAPPPLAPPGAQQFEQLRRKHRVPVLAPLPRSTRSSMRSESISPTLSATTSETPRPAP